jgi:hypothetical protein
MENGGQKQSSFVFGKLKIAEVSALQPTLNRGWIADIGDEE